MKQADIKRQHKEAFNTQTRQYKALKEKTRLDYVHGSSNGKREDLDVKLKTLKVEQRRKFDLLYQRYEETIQKMLDHQNFKLNSDQEEERVSLKAILDEDQKNLLALQEESRHRMEQQHCDERKQLERNIEERFIELNKQVRTLGRLRFNSLSAFRWNKSSPPTTKTALGNSPFSWRNNAANCRRPIPKSPISASASTIWPSPCKTFTCSRRTRPSVRLRTRTIARP